MEYRGIVARLIDGSGIIVDENGNEFIFNFGQIIGYKGEYPKELKQFSRKGLREGVLVKFTLDSGGQVLSIYPA